MKSKSRSIIFCIFPSKAYLRVRKFRHETFNLTRQVLSLIGSSSFGGDPLTGGGRYVPEGATSTNMALSNVTKDPKRPLSADMPLKDYHTFATASTKTLMEKLVRTDY